MRHNSLKTNIYLEQYSDRHEQLFKHVKQSMLATIALIFYAIDETDTSRKGHQTHLRNIITKNRKSYQNRQMHAQF